MIRSPLGASVAPPGKLMRADKAGPPSPTGPPPARVSITASGGLTLVAYTTPGCWAQPVVAPHDSMKPSPRDNCPNALNTWKFMGVVPESHCAGAIGFANAVATKRAPASLSAASAQRWLSQRQGEAGMTSPRSTIVRRQSDPPCHVRRDSVALSFYRG